MSAPTRRTALAALAGAGAVLGLPKLAHATTGGAPEFPALWLAFLRAQGALTAISHAQDAAEARLPWWAKPGPEKIDHEGRPCGPVSNWPAKQDVSPPEPGAYRQIRFGSADIHVRYDHFFGSPTARTLALAIRDRGLADLRERLAAEKVERAKVGLLDLEKQWERAADTLDEAQAAIHAFGHGPLDVLAARIILAAVLRCGVDDTAEVDEALSIATLALAGLLPHLSGELAADAFEFVQHPSRPMRFMRVSQGIGPDGTRVLA